MIGTPDGWYWRDRGATALVHVLAPQTRPAWEVEPLGAPHRIGLGLARALEGAREGNLTAVAALRWPEPGVVRANLPLSWVAELVAAGAAAKNPAPDALIERGRRSPSTGTPRPRRRRIDESYGPLGCQVPPHLPAGNPQWAHADQRPRPTLNQPRRARS